MRNSAMQIVTRFRPPLIKGDSSRSSRRMSFWRDVEDPRLIIIAEGDLPCHSLLRAPAWTLNLDCAEKDRHLAATSHTNKFSNCTLFLSVKRLPNQVTAEDESLGSITDQLDKNSSRKFIAQRNESLRSYKKF